jgi:hypothetical protein
MSMHPWYMKVGIKRSKVRQSLSIKTMREVSSQCDQKLIARVATPSVPYLRGGIAAQVIIVPRPHDSGTAMLVHAWSELRGVVTRLVGDLRMISHRYWRRQRSTLVDRAGGVAHGR